VSELRPGLEDVVVFETAISEPDREGGALRYRGVDVEELVGRRQFGGGGARAGCPFWRRPL
jgi:citrate synthase